MKGPALAEPRWYAVMTAARQELLALRNLKRAGFWTFHAFTRVRRARKIPGKAAKRIEWIEQPYFGRYVFVALRFAHETLDAVRPFNEMTGDGMEGISTVVRSRFSGSPLQIPEWAMERIFDYAAVRFGDGGLWLAALMEQVVLDEENITRLYVNRETGKRSIVTELRDAS